MSSPERMWNVINNFKWSNGKDRYAMTVSECISLIDSGRDSFDLIDNAFRYGFIKGMRYQKKQYKKKRKAQL